MTTNPGAFSVGRWLVRAVWLGAILASFAAVPAAVHAKALRPAEITAEQSQQAPYRDSGRIEVSQGTGRYLGTASYIRRYTGLTAGHILFSPKHGLSTDLHYDPALYISPVVDGAGVTYFAVLSGYQAASSSGGDDTDEAFDQDMGYLLFDQPALNDEWANWSDDLSYLNGSGPFLVLGYAAQSFAGDELAFVQHQVPYSQLLGPALYENSAYYTEGGMSGGPVYTTQLGGAPTMVAINVAGTDYSEAADSLARAITPAETPLLLDAEYAHGIITGYIRGPATGTAGSTLKLKTGLVFMDGAPTSSTVANKYDADVKLVGDAPYKKALVITKIKTGRYNVTLPTGLPHGTTVGLKLLRTALPAKGQTPLQTFTVTVD